MGYWKIKRRPADIKFSQWLRKKRNYICEKCGRRHQPDSKGLGVSHFWGRIHECTRFNEVNCDIFCNIPCHEYFETHRTEYEKWKEKRLGTKIYKELMLAAHQNCKKDDASVLLFLKDIEKKYKI